MEAPFNGFWTFYVGSSFDLFEDRWKSNVQYCSQETQKTCKMALWIQFLELHHKLCHCVVKVYFSSDSLALWKFRTDEKGQAFGISGHQLSVGTEDLILQSSSTCNRNNLDLAPIYFDLMFNQPKIHLLRLEVLWWDGSSGTVEDPGYHRHVPLRSWKWCERGGIQSSLNATNNHPRRAAFAI